MAIITKEEALKRIQAHVNKWESLDKEGLLMEVLEDFLDEHQLIQLMNDQDIPIVDGLL